MGRLRKRQHRITGRTRGRPKRRFRTVGLPIKGRRRRGFRQQGAPDGQIRAAGTAQLAGRAFEAGKSAALLPEVDGVSRAQAINSCWNDWRESAHVQAASWTAYHDIVRHFVQGFESGKGIRLNNPVLVPTRKTIGAVVTAMNEEKALPAVLDQLGRLPLSEIVIVVNGSTDRTFWSARTLSGGIVVHFMRPLGHDVGRAVGAKLTRSDILLFLDGDFPVFAEHLVPFIDAVDQGTDVALNDISPYIDVFANRDPVSVVKEMLNRSLGRADLEANSMTAVPHALSRQALETIGFANLMVPPKAQSIAVRSGLKVGCAMSVDVISKNRVRAKNSGHDNPVAHLIVGDHLEALSYLLRTEGPRLSSADDIRNRSVLGRVSS
jgi:hypothetical protein